MFYVVLWTKCGHTDAKKASEWQRVAESVIAPASQSRSLSKIKSGQAEK